MTLQVQVVNKRKNPQVEEFTRDRLQMVVGRFADRIAHLVVHLFDENGIKGGNDKICTVDIKLDPRGQLHVRAKHDDVYAAITKAVHRAETVVAKAVDRRHRVRDGRHRQDEPRLAPNR